MIEGLMQDRNGREFRMIRTSTHAALALFLAGCTATGIGGPRAADARFAPLPEQVVALTWALGGGYPQHGLSRLVVGGQIVFPAPKFFPLGIVVDRIGRNEQRIGINKAAATHAYVDWLSLSHRYKYGWKHGVDPHADPPFYNREIVEY